MWTFKNFYTSFFIDIYPSERRVRGLSVVKNTWSSNTLKIPNCRSVVFEFNRKPVDLEKATVRFMESGVNRKSVVEEKNVISLKPSKEKQNYVAAYASQAFKLQRMLFLRKNVTDNLTDEQLLANRVIDRFSKKKFFKKDFFFNFFEVSLIAFLSLLSNPHFYLSVSSKKNYRLDQSSVALVGLVCSVRGSGWDFFFNYFSLIQKLYDSEGSLIGCYASRPKTGLTVSLEEYFRFNRERERIGVESSNAISLIFPTPPKRAESFLFKGWLLKKRVDFFLSLYYYQHFTFDVSFYFVNYVRLLNIFKLPVT